MPIGSNIHKTKVTNIFKMLFFQMRGVEIFLTILGIIGSMAVGVTLSLCGNLALNGLDKFGKSAIPQEIRQSAFEVFILLCILAAIVFVSGIMMSGFFSYIGKKISNKYKCDYFKFLMQKDQIWFDKMKGLEIFNKFLLEMDKVEKGVKLFFKFRQE